MKRLSTRRAIGYVAYYGFARHLPWSPQPGGRFARFLRGACARAMLDACGTHVNVEHGAWFGSGRDIRVGDRSAIGMDALVIGPLTIGNDVMMGPRCILLAQNHAFDDGYRTMNQQGFSAPARILIEDDVWVGANVTILPGRRIGRGSIVGASSTVTSDVPPFAIVAGNPARIVGSRAVVDGEASTDL